MSQQQPVTLSIRPFTPATLPTEQNLIDASKAVLQNLDSWKTIKTYRNKRGHHPYTVKTFVKPKAPAEEVSWFMRYSVHTPKEDGNFDDFWNLLGKNKAINEKEFIPAIKSVALLKAISPTQSIWTLYYTFPPPVSPRIFTVLQLVHITGGEHGLPREGWIISVPVDVSEDPEMKAKEMKGTRGRYASIEVLKEKEDGSVEWRMATTSTPGGLIPKVVAQKSIPGQIEKDVGHFLDWLQKKRGSASSQAQTTTPDAAPEEPAPTEPAATAETNGELTISVDEQLTVNFDGDAVAEQTMGSTDAAMPSDVPAPTAETTHM